VSEAPSEATLIHVHTPPMRYIISQTGFQWVENARGMKLFDRKVGWWQISERIAQNKTDEKVPLPKRYWVIAICYEM
jgi:hypothetical protein